ncbi:hypothetical protein MQX03_15405 [Chryseobacterium aahli]|nr:hypothetical protein [Chryseobacterium aahli]MCI3938585.1 hypothetical protein [Chryseobacterium aahli]
MILQEGFVWQQFAAENDWVADLASFYSEKPSSRNGLWLILLWSQLRINS